MAISVLSSATIIEIDGEERNAYEYFSGKMSFDYVFAFPLFF
jgi:hypothetical protein